MRILLTETNLNIIMMAIWLFVFIMAVIVESQNAEVVSVWFGVGALVALVFTFIPGVPFWVEIIVFFVVSTLALLLFRPMVKKVLNKKMPKEELERIIGKTGRVASELKDDELFEVEIDGVTWRAIPSCQDTYLVNDKIVVKDIKGNKLVVEKEKEN